MRKVICFFVILAMAVPLAFAGGGGDIGADSGIKNKIVIYTSMYQEVIDSVSKTLAKEFPRYKIELVYAGTGRIKHMIESEQAFGRLECDILMIAEPSYSLELKKKGLLHQFKYKEAARLAFDYDTEGYWYPVRIDNMVLAYNPEKNAKNTIPNSFYDFAHDTKVRNGISMRNPNISGTSMATLSALYDKYGSSFFESLGRQGMHMEYGSDGALAKLESGEYKVIMVLEETILQKRQKEGSKLEIIYPTDGTVMIPSTIMIINNKWSANRNARIAEEITEWFLSEKGQNAIVDGWMHSVRADFKRIPYGSIPTEDIRAGSIPVNWENNERERIIILDLLERR